MTDFYDRLTVQCRSSVVDLNTIASQMGIINTASSSSSTVNSATATNSNSYIYTTTTGDSNSYIYNPTTGNFDPLCNQITVPAGMLPESMPAWPGNPDVPSRKYIHDHMNTHWITELIDRCIDEIQDIYRAKAEGEDTNMPINPNTPIYTNNELRKIFGLDDKSSDTAGYPTPKLVKVETYNDRVVKLTFEDGSFTKSVCSDNDTFDLDVGITICILKRVMGKNGHKLYNNMMRDIHKIMDENEKDKEKARKDKAERKAKQRKTELKAAAKKAKARQDQIDIQKTAFVEALRASGIGSGDDLK